MVVMTVMMMRVQVFSLLMQLRLEEQVLYTARNDDWNGELLVLVNSSHISRNDGLTWYTHTHNRSTAGLEYVRVHPGQQVPER